MSDYDNNLSGALFANKKAEGKQPSHKGQCEINGVTYDIAGWKKESKKGTPYLFLKFQVPRESEDDEPPRKPAPKQVEDDFDF